MSVADVAEPQDEHGKKRRKSAMEDIDTVEERQFENINRYVHYAFIHRLTAEVLMTVIGVQFG